MGYNFLKCAFVAVIAGLVLLAKQAQKAEASAESYIEKALAAHFQFREVDPAQYEKNKPMVSFRDRIFMPGVKEGVMQLPYMDFYDPEIARMASESYEMISESCLDKVGKMDPESKKYLWCLESPAVSRGDYKKLMKGDLVNKFDLIFTFSKDLLKHGEPFKFVPTAYSTMGLNPPEISEKTKEVSIIASKKNFFQGHKLRHAIIERFRPMITSVYGWGYNPIGSNADGLREYRYCIVVENCKEDYYFSEKLIDCILCGTIPIYWGCPSIGAFFDKRGMIVFDRLEELESILEDLSQEDYETRKEYVIKNYEMALNYLHPSRYMRQLIEEQE